MPLRPRRLPARFNRRIHGDTRRLVERRHRRHRSYTVQRWMRIVRRVQARYNAVRNFLVRYFKWLASAVVLFLVGLMLFSPFLHVQEIRVSRSDQRIDSERIQRSLSSLFGEHLLFLSGRDVLPLIRKAVPDLEGVTIDKQYPSSLAIRVTLQPVVARLDIVEAEEEESGTGAALGDFLTSSGMYVTYPPAIVQSGSLLPLVKVVDWGVKPIPGMRLIDPDLLLSMQEAEATLQSEFGEEIRGRTVFLRAREFHLEENGYDVWFDSRGDVAEHIDRYRVFLRTVGRGAVRDYVDLRLKNKVVYR